MFLFSYFFFVRQLDFGQKTGSIFSTQGVGEMIFFYIPRYFLKDGRINAAGFCLNPPPELI